MSVVPICKEYRNMQPEDILPLFMAFKAASGLSGRTLGDYKTILGIFFSRYPDALDYPRERTMAFLAGYSNPSSYNIRFAYLKVFWSWCVSEGLFRGDRFPLDGLKKRRPRGRIVQLSEGEVARLLKQPDRSTYAGLRDFTGILLQVDTGIRPGEMLALLPDDFAPARGGNNHPCRTRQNPDGPDTTPITTHPGGHYPPSGGATCGVGRGPHIRHKRRAGL